MAFYWRIYKRNKQRKKEEAERKKKAKAAKKKKKKGSSLLSVQSKAGSGSFARMNTVVTNTGSMKGKKPVAAKKKESDTAVDKEGEEPPSP